MSQTGYWSGRWHQGQQSREIQEDEGGQDRKGEYIDGEDGRTMVNQEGEDEWPREANKKEGSNEDGVGVSSGATPGPRAAWQEKIDD